MNPPSLDEIDFVKLYEFIKGKTLIDPLDLLINIVDKDNLIEYVDAFNMEKNKEKSTWLKSSSPMPNFGPYHLFIYQILLALIDSTNLKKVSFPMMHENIRLSWDD